MLLPTARKAKIGKDFSWPLGAETISAFLADVPQANLICLEFREPEPGYNAELRPPVVFAARYYFKASSVFFPRRPEVPRPLTPSWTIEIWANLRSHKARIRELLLDDGLPKHVKPWLLEMHGPYGREGEAFIRLYFDRANGGLLAQQRGTIMPAPAR